jgi:hypothetical protein
MERRLNFKDILEHLAMLQNASLVPSGVMLLHFRDEQEVEYIGGA